MNNSVQKPATPGSGAVTLRAVTPEDESFLLGVYASTRAEELAAVPWNEEQRAAFVRFQFTAQSQYYETEYPAAQHQIILRSQEPVGRLYVDRREHEIRILDLTILPAHCGAGIGTQLIRELMREAAESGRSLTIQLEFFSRSRSLFTRLGFVPRSESGIRTLFEWRAETA
ncbi:MAG TPA: GNAT family N-acetyltransferase [Blastocatellia bacterium]|nr:GNAT family N-acetyltransferase [Blastocatellia bacterium]